MNMLFLKKKYDRKSFFLDLLLKKEASLTYSLKLTNTITGKIFLNNTPSEPILFKRRIHVIYDVPNYLKKEFYPPTLKMITIPLYKGYLIRLSDYNNVEDYLRSNFGKTSRSKLRRYQKRLDLCIAPIYKMYYGKIPKDVYNYLFDQLKLMLEKRFFQKQENNFELPFIGFYREIMYPMIMDKQAALFVIYDKKKPINIGVNFISNQTIFAFDSCYDIDYSSFNLGHIDMLKHINWCYDNDIKIMDMGRGDFFHKRRWVTHTYHYQEYIAYDSDSLYITFFAHIKALFPLVRYHLIKLLKKMEVHIIYGNYKKVYYRFLKKNKEEDIGIKYETNANYGKIPLLEKGIRLNPYKKEYSFLMKPINDFLFANHESNKDIKIFMEIESKNSYYIVGKSKARKITVLQ